MFGVTEFRPISLCKERPREMPEFRPISLCNISYKIISKLLSKRLKRVLPELISETQYAFVARRLITNNILLAQENFHALRNGGHQDGHEQSVRQGGMEFYPDLDATFGFCRKFG